MRDLFWPGDDRAADTFTSEALLEAMVEVEAIWLDVLGVSRSGIDLSGLTGEPDLDWMGDAAEAGGNPVLPLVQRLRDGLGDTEAARWLHRGLTSQDVMDSALMMLLGRAVALLLDELRPQIAMLVALAEVHRDTPMVARTLTQHAVPTTFGLKVATWLTGVLDAYDDVVALTFPVQLGGAAGTLAALVELGRPVGRARTDLADGLGLGPALPWHTTRRPVTRIGDALVACTDAWARIANDVVTLSRPEIGELSEGAGGGSSTMPHKSNPVLSVLIRRAALTTPQLAATLHLAAADQADERAAGGWHAEWGTLEVLVRRVIVAARQTSALLDDLQVHDDRMVATLEAARDDVHAEQRAMARLAGHEPAGAYVGAASALIDSVIDRAQEAIG